MKSLKYILLVSTVLSVMVCNAQTKNLKTEGVTIYGNCEICESMIEKAGNMKNHSNVDWNKDTKVATISFDSLKTTMEEILKRIALAGYDSHTFLAPDDTYSNLPDCCRYERVKKIASKIDESKMDMTIPDHLIDSGKMAEMQGAKPLSAVYDNYFRVKDALVKTDGVMASNNAKNLLTAINAVKMDDLPTDIHLVWMKALEKLKEDVTQITITKEVDQQRDHFISLSNTLYEVLKVSKQETPIYYQFCPMANDGKGANWLSKEEIIKNPYYGLQMLSCGKTVEIIKK